MANRKFRKGQVVVADKNATIFPLRYRGRKCVVAGYEGKTADGEFIYTVQVRERKEPLNDIFETELRKA